MKLRILTLFLALLLPLRAAELASFLVPDAALAVTATDMKALNKAYEHPVFKAVLTPEIKRAFGPLIDQMKEANELSEKIWKEETGLSVDEATALFGDFTMAMRIPIPELAEAMSKNPGEPPFDLFSPTVAMQFKGDDAMAEKFAKAYARAMKAGFELGQKAGPAAPSPFPTDLDETTDEHSGVKLHIWKSKEGKFPIQPSWALVDKVILMSFTERGLRDAIDRSKKGAASLADHSRFRDVVARGKGAEVIAFLDLGRLIGDGLKMAADAAPDAAMVQAVVTSLGVDKFEAGYMLFDLADKAIAMEFGVTYQKKPAVLDVIAIDGPGAAPDFIPVTANSASYGTFHWDRVLPAIEKILSATAPEAVEALNKQLAELKELASVDVRKDILSNLGPDVWSASAPATTAAAVNNPAGADSFIGLALAEPQVLGVKLRDRKAIELALKSLINAFGSGASIFDEREVQGFTINNLKGVPMPVGYVITDDWLIFSAGEQGLLEKILSRIKKPGGDSIFSLPDVKDAIAALPANDDGTSYMDVGSLIGSIVGMLRELPDVPELKEIVDFKKLPENPKIPLIMAMRTYLDDQAMRIRMHMVEKSK
jgi:Protein of unknown function (DUF3352)